MKNTLKLSKDLDLPADAVTQTFAFLARKGAGKTYGAGVLAEEMLEHDDQVLVLDPVGNWWGLTAAADGKGKGYKLPVFGGLHGDLPLEPGAGALIADVVVDRGTSAILDVSMFRKGDRKRFAVDFAEQLFHRKKAARSPVHLFIEEAQVFVPQRVMGDEARMLGAFEDLVKLGRNFGIGVTLISQRPQAVNKDALNQTECLVVLQTNGAQERKAIRDWIVEQSLDVEDLVDELPSLERGEAWVWSPSWLRRTIKVQIGKKRTFDASATPDAAGQKKAARRELEPEDLVALKAAMKDVVARAEADDPRKLQAKVRDLEARLKKASNASPAPAAVAKEWVDVAVLKDGQIKRLEGALDRLDRLSAEGVKYAQDLAGAWGTLNELGSALVSAMRSVTNAPPPAKAQLRAVPPPAPRAPPPLRSERVVGDDMERSPRPSELKVLECAASKDGLTKKQLGIRSGYRPNTGHFGNMIGFLIGRGYMEKRGASYYVADAGRVLVPDARPLTGGELQEKWKTELRPAEWTLLEALLNQWPRFTPKSAWAEATGYRANAGHFGNMIGKLVGSTLVDKTPEGYRAAAEFFDS